MEIDALYLTEDATGLAERVQSGEVEPGTWVEAALRRIEAVNPRLNAITVLDPAQARLAAGKVDRSAPFAGVPVLLKDAHLAKGLAGFNGLAPYKQVIADYDSHMAAALRRAGFVILGKTTMPEFGLKALTEATAWGPTRNPWNPERTPGGSSGGSGAAVASGMVPLATASDGGGSIRIPAAYCGLFGLKPTRSRISVGPELREVWEGLGVDGILARSVRDTARALDCLSGFQPADPYAAPPQAVPFENALSASLKHLRVAVDTRNPLGETHPEARRAVEKAISALTSLGATVEEARPQIDLLGIYQAYLMVYKGHLSAEFKNLRERFGDDVDRQLERDSRIIAAIGDHVSAGDYYRSRDFWHRLGQAMVSLHERYDLYLTPTTAMPPARIGELELSLWEQIATDGLLAAGLGGVLRHLPLVEQRQFQMLARTPFTMLANLTGQPAMSVPLHRDADGQPWGVQMIAPFGQESLLLTLAATLERSSWWQQQPATAVKQS